MLLMQHNQRQKGFTLIELMVVLTLIGLFFLAFIRLSDGFFVKDVEDELITISESFVNASVVASDQAVLTGDPIGLVVTAPFQPPEKAETWKLNWKLYRGGEWVETLEPLVAIYLRDGLEVALIVEGESIDFEKVKVLDEETEEPVPVIVFYPGGEITPFRLTVYDGQSFERQVILSTERTGRVEAFSTIDDISIPVLSDELSSR